ncbi:MAG: UPF0175 family protein [Thiomargarita sp.]|nr:UPF0175 family protein [Thiomargarita sp.]
MTTRAELYSLIDTLPDSELSAVRWFLKCVQNHSDLTLQVKNQQATLSRYLRGEISQEQAAKFVGLNRRDFLLELASEKQDVFAVDFDDLKEEIARG